MQVLVENKFGAALTGNQPVEYLRSLRGAPGATLLLFIAPKSRKEGLWQELLARVEAEAESWPQVEVERFVVELTGPVGTVCLAKIREVL